MIKLKYCQGFGKAKGFEGCGEKMILKKYGLCSNCLRIWMKTTKEGKEFYKKKYELQGKIK